MCSRICRRERPRAFRRAGRRRTGRCRRWRLRCAPDPAGSARAQAPAASHGPHRTPVSQMQAPMRPPAAPGTAPGFPLRAVSRGRPRARSGISKTGRCRTRRNETAAQHPASKEPFPGRAAGPVSPERARSLRLVQNLPKAALVLRGHARKAAPHRHRRAPPTPGLPAAGNRAARSEHSDGSRRCAVP